MEYVAGSRGAKYSISMTSRTAGVGLESLGATGEEGVVSVASGAEVHAPTTSRTVNARERL
jgi:hypothetical protein